MGFSAVEQGHTLSSVERDKVLQFVEPEDLLTYGFIPEFIGRLPMITVLEELTEEQLVQILTETKNALTKQFAKLMAMEGVELEFTPDALHELAARPSRKAPARARLRTLLENLMLDVMYEIPTSEDIVAVKITRPVVRGETKPILRRKPNQAAA